MERRESSAGAAIKFRAVSKSFQAGRRRVDALREVSFEVRKGQITGLIGPDGAGKTTLMQLTAGLLLPDSGQGQALGLDIARQALAIQASVGYMPQRFGLYEDLTVQENLDLYADLQGVAKTERSARYRELMRMTGLSAFTGRPAGRLSGGMKQKLGLACTLVNPPKLLLLDEPTVGVDPVSRRELWQIIDRYVHEEGTTVLLSTAYLDEAERCSEVIILHEGQLLGHGPPEQFSKPLAGRTFRVRVSGMRNRDLQVRLARSPQVTDAVIQGDTVRLVMESGSTPSAASLLSEIENAVLERVPPRFEDGFVSMLGEHLEQAGLGTPEDRSESLDSLPRHSDGFDRQTSRPAQKRERREKDPSETSSVAPPGATAGKSRDNGNGAAVMIEVRDVQKRFGDFYAVKNVSFDVEQGEVFGLLGANGAGKTTTFRMLCGLLPVSAGNLHVAGVDVRRTAAAARARIGYMSQKFSLYGSLSVAQNLVFFGSAYGLKGKRRKDRINWAIDQFELTSVTNTTSGTLPLGYKQRLALACALMHEPDILFLDEPTSGVDPLARREFWHRINELAGRGVTVLVTTHFMEEAEYCDRVAIMVDGEILALGAPSEIKQGLRSPDQPEPTMEDAFIHVLQSKHTEQRD